MTNKDTEKEMLRLRLRCWLMFVEALILLALLGAGITLNIMRVDPDGWLLCVWALANTAWLYANAPEILL